MSASAKPRPTPKLQRETFRTSREMDFFSEKELVTQTGHPMHEWPLVIAKELIDNSLDACEEADIPPIIAVTADPCGISVADNGPGISEATIAGLKDYRVRVSSREAYVAPDRGRQGNALKTLLPMPWVADPGHGRMVITTQGRRHVITCRVDQVSQRPVIDGDPTDPPKSKKTDPTTNGKASFLSGTEVRLEWGARAESGAIVWPFEGQRPGSVAARFRALIEGYALFNPHLTIRLDWFGEATLWEAANPEWTKWKPCKPTSALWYELPHFKRLIGACVTRDRESGADRLISEFIAGSESSAGFDGISGSVKRMRVLTEAGLKRARLSELVQGGRFDEGRVARLWEALRKHSRPVNPLRLGVIGKDHFRERFLGMGIAPDSFRYCRKLAKSKKTQPGTGEKPSFLPWVLETAFGYRGEGAGDERCIFSGANWSAAINNPFRTFGATGEGLETTLADLKATQFEPVVFAIHLAHPRVEYTDRGKSALVITSHGEREE
jgi:hypothetical protein